MPTKLPRLTITLPPDTFAALVAVAQHNRRSASAEAVIAVDSHLGAHKGDVAQIIRRARATKPKP